MLRASHIHDLDAFAAAIPGTSRESRELVERRRAGDVIATGGQRARSDRMARSSRLGVLLLAARSCAQLCSSHGLRRLAWACKRCITMRDRTTRTGAHVPSLLVTDELMPPRCSVEARIGSLAVTRTAALQVVRLCAVEAGSMVPPGRVSELYRICGVVLVAAQW